jgi:radical SAM superfamily enzyme YgiQ (UPF0313 family)
MLIYLAELSHTGKGRSPNVVPLAAGYLASYAKKIYPELEIEIYRDPDQLLMKAENRHPDIVGFSVYAWSDRLSYFCAKKIKGISKKTMTVAGGASVDDIDSELLHYLIKHPYYDVCCPNEGEISFVKLVEHIKTNGEFLRDKIIEGCAYLASDGSLLRGAYNKPTLSEIPSPYLTGILDSYLLNEYIPIIQSMRGCPYSCTFCVSGNKQWSKVEGFALERVFAEIDYIRKIVKNNYLILTDENLGILQDRDIRLAEYIINSYRNGGFPSKIYFYSAKIVTDYVLKVVEILNEVGEFGMSFQTLSEMARKEIKRTNIQWHKYVECLEWAKKRNIITSTEMIFGFPGETLESYLRGIESLLKSGVNRIYSYNLRLLEGIDLSTNISRQKYQYQTMFRLMERTFGVYKNEVVSEVEEVVVGSTSFDYNVYKKIRFLGLFLEIVSGRGYFTELLNLMMDLNMPGEKMITYLLNYDYKKYPKINGILNEYSKRAEEELFETPEECEDHVRKIINNGYQVPEVKLNLIFTGKIVLNCEVRTELMEIIKEFIRPYCRNKEQVYFFEDYVDNILAKQIVSFNDEKEFIECKTHIHIDRLNRKEYHSLKDLISKEAINYYFKWHKDSIEFIKNNPILNYENEDLLQDLYMSISRFGLMRIREIECKENETLHDLSVSPRAYS